jgi:16S rRNA (guanine966-N2)-methyltransferase
VSPPEDGGEWRLGNLAGMRVISGTHKGRRLRAPDAPGTRPVTDRVKESIFSSLGSEIRGAVIADLYAGAGSFGIEALSRGAERVTFVESSRVAVRTLRENLAVLDLPGEIVEGDVGRFLSSGEARFDVVFCDPPWPLPSPALAAVLETLATHLAEEAVVVVTRRSSDPIPLPYGYLIEDDRTFGDTRIIRYRRESA